MKPSTTDNRRVRWISRRRAARAHGDEGDDRGALAMIVTTAIGWIFGVAMG
jgi:hypothetical protein